jgi:putative endonuclease
MFNNFLKNTSPTYRFGMSGEEMAVKYLKDKGYKILERNYKNRSGRQLGEIDIVAEKGKEIFFVEVKTRTAENIENILPEQNINPGKLRKLSKIAQYYIKDRKLWDLAYHFDAVSVLIEANSQKTEIKHLQDIFF